MSDDAPKTRQLYAQPAFSRPTYARPEGGLPPQSDLLTGRSVFTDAYTVITKGCMTDIVTSYMPFWNGMRMWVLARPMTGFAETFSHYIVELDPEGGCDKPETSAGVQGVLFVVAGELELRIGENKHKLDPGSYVYLAPDEDWSIVNQSSDKATFHWLRKRYQTVEGLDKPDTFVTHELDTAPLEMPDTQWTWSTTRFADPRDMRHDMHVNIVNIQPGGVIPFLETHVMEHGLYVLEGKGVYRLNQDWVEVEAGDYMWLRAFCPQACYAGGPGPFRYLLYKDVNRHAAL